MIVKPLEFSLDLRQISALKGRMPDKHQLINDLNRQFYQELAGYNGEKEVYYQLQFLPKNDYFIFHYLRLYDQLTQSFYQIDFLLITQHFILLLEVKNHKGSVYFNQFDQFVHLKEDGTEESYPNPISQVERQAFQLQSWLYENGYFNIPIITNVVFCSSTRLIKSNHLSEENLSKITPIPQLVNKTLSLFDTYTRSKPKLFSNDIRTLSENLLLSHSPLQRNLLEKYNISPSSLKKGVQCPKCKIMSMRRIYNKWKCTKCKLEGRHYHYGALNDYYLLIDDTITNKQAREFLNIESSTVTYKLLKNSPYEKIGKTPRLRYKMKYIDINKGV